MTRRKKRRCVGYKKHFLLALRTWEVVGVSENDGSRTEFWAICSSGNGRNKQFKFELLKTPPKIDSRHSGKRLNRFSMNSIDSTQRPCSYAAILGSCSLVERKRGKKGKIIRCTGDFPSPSKIKQSPFDTPNKLLEFSCIQYCMIDECEQSRFSCQPIFPRVYPSELLFCSHAFLWHSIEFKLFNEWDCLK